MTGGRLQERFAFLRSPSSRRESALAVDVFERLLVLGLYGWLVARILSALHSEGAALGNLLLLVSEGIVLVFILARRATRDVSVSPSEWLLAIAATCLPMLVAPASAHPLVTPFQGSVVLVMGMIVQLHAKATLGRSFGCVPANRGLKADGPYRLVRHPMYAGYLLSHVAFLLLNPSWRNLGLYVGCTLLQIPRLLAEERLLSRDEGYRRYRSIVRHRLIPGLF
jgi:protein-S-isoprenylcysteine O-methyltransferase Ste14